MGAFGLRIGLRHIRSSLGLAVVVRTITVVDVARRIHPHQAWAATRRLRHRRGLRRRRSLRRWSRSSRSCRRNRGRHLRRRSSGRCNGSRWRRSGRRSSRRIPLLHTLMPAAGPLFAGSRRIGSIFALSGRSRRCLSHRNLRRQKTRCYRHQTNRCLHKNSR